VSENEREFFYLDEGVDKIDLTFHSAISLSQDPESKNVKAYYAIFKHLAAFDKDFSLLNEQMNKLQKVQQSNPQEFQNKKQEIVQQYMALVANRKSFFDSLKTVYNTPYVKDLSEALVIDTTENKENYFEEAYFTDRTFTSGDFLPRILNQYMRSFAQLSTQNLSSEVAFILSHAPEGSKGREIAYDVLFRVSYYVNQDYAKKIAQQYDAEYPASPYPDRLLRNFPPDVGDKAPEISLKNPEGKEISLTEMEGKVVLLDFWASWCGPCRRENPHVVKVYNEFKDEGFTVYSVSLDKSKDRWMQAINQDGLIWPNHVSDLSSWKSAGAQTYRVSSIPSTFLIDENGVIIAKNLRGQQLHNKLEEIFHDNN
jgi:peroxiredoxin